MTVRVRDGLIWFVVSAGFYFALVSSYGWAEIVVGLGAGVVGAVVALATRAAESARGRPSVAWVRWVVPIPGAVLGDTARLGVLLAGQVFRRRPVPSEFREIRFPVDSTERGSAYRAAATWVLSYAPGAYVVDVDPDTGRVLLHDLGGGPSAVEGMVTG